MTSGGRRRRSGACHSRSSTAGSTRPSSSTDWKREIKEEQVSETKLRRTLTLTDPNSGLEVQAVCTIYLDTAGVDWTVYFTNKGSHDTPVIEQVRAVDATVDVGLRVQRGDPPAQRCSVRDRRLDAVRPGGSRRDRRWSSRPPTAGRRTSLPGSTSTGAEEGSLRPSAGPVSGRPPSNCETASCAPRPGCRTCTPFCIRGNASAVRGSCSSTGRAGTSIAPTTCSAAPCSPISCRESTARLWSRRLSTSARRSTS